MSKDTCRHCLEMLPNHKRGCIVKVCPSIAEQFEQLQAQLAAVKGENERFREVAELVIRLRSLPQRTHAFARLIGKIEQAAIKALSPDAGRDEQQGWTLFQSSMYTYAHLPPNRWMFLDHSGWHQSASDGKQTCEVFRAFNPSVVQLTPAEAADFIKLHGLPGGGAR